MNYQREHANESYIYCPIDPRANCNQNSTQHPTPVDRMEFYYSITCADLMVSKVPPSLLTVAHVTPAAVSTQLLAVNMTSRACGERHDLTLLFLEKNERN